MNLMPKAVRERQGTFTRLLAPTPEHVKQPTPCCHMYSCFGGCTDEHTKEEKKK